MKKRLLIVKMVVSMAMLFFVVLPALAVTHSVSPLIIEQSVVPRDGFEEMVTITNTSNRMIRIYPTVNEIVLGSDNEIREFVMPATIDRTTSVTSWIEVTRGRIEIMPGEKAEVPVLIKIHHEAKPGNYYAFVGFPEASKRHEGEAQVMRGTAAGVLVRLALPDTSTELLRVQRIHSERFVYNEKTRMLEISLENTGDKNTLPAGEIILYDTRGSEVVSLPFNIDQKVINAGAQQTFYLRIPDSITMGKHKALVNINYGSSQRAAIHDTIYFTAVPIWWLSAIFIACLMTAVFLVLWYHRKMTPSEYVGEGEDVSFYVRTHTTASDSEHDINLKS